VISSRQILLAKFEELKRQFADGHVPKPEGWGGFRVIPETIEFWQGGSARLHDRFLYTRNGEAWKIERLAP
jgi:pyridoxamine 5'-phosphate oxidase